MPHQSKRKGQLKKIPGRVNASGRSKHGRRAASAEAFSQLIKLPAQGGWERAVEPDIVRRHVIDLFPPTGCVHRGERFYIVGGEIEAG